jgi:glycosyltransferase involved in cell wall biosynthesis
MRLTLVTETYFPQVNGVSRTLGEVVRHMTARGDAVQVVHPDYGEPPTEAEECLARSLTVPFYRELHLPIPPFGAVHRAIDRFRPDLVHIATEAMLGWSVLRRSIRRNIPVVSSFHTNFDQYSDHYRVGWARGTIWRYMRWFHNQTAETYVPSRTTIASLESKGFERLVLWPRGVDGGVFRPDRPGRWEVRHKLGWGPDAFVIGYVSRIAPEKNVDYLAAALEIVAAERPNIRALLVGDGPSRAELESRLGRFGRFAGYQTGEALADHYAACDLFAFSSLTETFGNVVLEAMSSGLPVVGLRAGGVADVVRDRVTGVLIDPADPPRKFADALISIIDRVDVRRKMRDAAREHASSQSWDAIMAGLRQRYVKTIEG